MTFSLIAIFVLAGIIIWLLWWRVPSTAKVKGNVIVRLYESGNVFLKQETEANFHIRKNEVVVYYCSVACDFDKEHNVDQITLALAIFPDVESKLLDVEPFVLGTGRRQVHLLGQEPGQPILRLSSCIGMD